MTRGKRYHIDQLTEEQAASQIMYYEFLRVPELSMGIYKLKAGEKDPQSPHNQDEVYYIVEGQGKIRVGEEDFECKPGSIIYVEKHAAHKFHSISADMKILVMFAPAEG